nr:hypothetical protein CFP56_54503 [Quercus suber]
MNAASPQLLSYANAARQGNLQSSSGVLSPDAPEWRLTAEAGRGSGRTTASQWNITSTSSRPEWLTKYLQKRKPPPRAFPTFEDIKANLRRPLQGMMPRTVEKGCNCVKCKPDMYRELLHVQDMMLMAHGKPGRVDILKTIDNVRLHGLRYHQHDVINIAVLAVRSFSFPIDQFSQGQKQALEKWKEWIASEPAKALCSMHPGNVREETLQRVAAVLNDIFFLGQLPPSIFHVVWDGNLAARSIASSSSVTLQFKARKTEQHDICRIHPRSEYIKLDMKAVVSVLLHEMCHSFLSRYGCDGAAVGSCKSPLCQQRSWQNGRDHGRGWQWLSKGIEDRMFVLLGFKRSLGRTSCLVNDLRSKYPKGIPCFRPTACEIEDMFSSHDEAGMLIVSQSSHRALGDEVMWQRIHNRIEEKWFLTFWGAGGGGKRRRSI